MAQIFEGDSFDLSNSDHFSYDATVTPVPATGAMAIDYEIKKLKYLRKDTSWSSIKHLMATKLFREES